MNHSDVPNALEMERKLLSALLIKEGQSVPGVVVILEPDDFYRPEHRLIFRAIVRLYTKDEPIDYLAVEQELRAGGDLKRIDHRYLLSIIDATNTNALAVYHAKIIKEKANLRRVMQISSSAYEEAQKDMRPSTEIIADAQGEFDKITNANPLRNTNFADFFAKHFQDEVDAVKDYAQRLTGFYNLDAEQLFSPGLYVIGATPAAGKTTFCWQLLEQLARRGESCIYCSYEMSKFELFTKSLAREIFKRDTLTTLTAAQIRKGARSAKFDKVVEEFSADTFNLSVLELQEETIDDLINLLKPLCSDQNKAPVVCLDYLQIMPTSRESARRGIDDSVRKLKKFQRDTNTTFIVISSFNRTNYAQTVSFESFKESGNIEYTADVVWALQLDLMNRLRSYTDLTEARKKIEDAKKNQPRQINLKCLKNRQGTNYTCFFRYYSAHDYFEPCDKFVEEIATPKKSASKDI